MSFRKIGLSVLLLSVCVLANDLMAQPGGNRGRGGFNFGGGGMIGLLQIEDVQKKLDLTDKQIDEVKELADDLRAKIQEKIQDRDFQGVREIAEDANTEAKDVLLDNQVKLLDKIQNQQRYLRGNNLRVDKRFFTDVLELSDDEADDAMKSLEEVQKDFNKKVAEALQDMMKELKKDLPKDAAKKFEELLGGDIIQIEMPQRGGRGGAQGGGRGGQGGGRGGQGGGRGQRPQGGDDF